EFEQYALFQEVSDTGTLNEAYLDDMRAAVLAAKAHGALMVLVEVPVSRGLQSAYPAHLYAEFLSRTRQIADEWGAAFVPFKDVGIQLSDADMWDLGHVNVQGAEKFSRAFAPILAGFMGCKSQAVACGNESTADRRPEQRPMQNSPVPHSLPALRVAGGSKLAEKLVDLCLRERGILLQQGFEIQMFVDEPQKFDLGKLHSAAPNSVERFLRSSARVESAALLTSLTGSSL
ncbi:MAG: hypothetical protein MUP20_07575, partial [Methyloceanibacter sp.]|nr:hypothetical protein [Methyloceanibacter sp.]